jgi:hypothetical protein
MWKERENIDYRSALRTINKLGDETWKDLGMDGGQFIRNRLKSYTVKLMMC